MAYRLRNAVFADAPQLAEKHVRTFREAHGGGPPVSLREQQWATVLSKDSPDDSTFVVEDESGALVGFARVEATPDPDPLACQGHLSKIYVLRAHHGRGIGRSLLLEAARRLRKMGANSMNLFGDARNPSNGFYERMGAERTYAENGDFHGGYGWRDLGKLLAAD
jgi:ribosomal protein S18 acetylase RimI-like enzyme